MTEWIVYSCSNLLVGGPIGILLLNGWLGCWVSVSWVHCAAQCHVRRLAHQWWWRHRQRLQMLPPENDRCISWRTGIHLPALDSDFFLDQFIISLQAPPHIFSMAFCLCLCLCLSFCHTSCFCGNVAECSHILALLACATLVGGML